MKAGLREQTDQVIDAARETRELLAAHAADLAMLSEELPAWSDSPILPTSPMSGNYFANLARYWLPSPP